MAKKCSITLRLQKRILCGITAGTMLFSTLSAFSFPVSAASSNEPFLLKAGSVPVHEDRFTKGGPFPEGTGNSQHFRIPALITLENGDLLATADARYDRISGDGSSPDGGGLDTIASVSSDGGKTWRYSFPIYFPDSLQNAATDATTIIDPGVMEGPDGTIYCIADVNPTGVTTMGGYHSPGYGTGYIEIDGTQRLALTDSFDYSANRPDTAGVNYEYYVGDYTDGFAPVLNRSDHTPTAYCVDEWFNIYQTEADGSRKELKQKQVDSDTDIQQNAFYRDSILHVYKTGYLWMVSSTDHGRTWGNPTILNTQIKRSDDSKDKALLVSPGRGITTRCGDIVIGFYNSGNGYEASSIVYSSDNGSTWRRTEDNATVADTEINTSSENEIVELEDGTLRMFFRHGGYQAAVGKLCYVDAKKQEDGSYRLQTPVVSDVDSVHSGCNLSAISYSKKINGRQVILVSAPKGVRANGQILTLTVDPKDQTLECIQRFEVPGGQGSYGSYVYSCLTELEDGSIGLLWEPNHKAINYSRFLIDEEGRLSPYPSAATSVELKKDNTFSIPHYKGDKNITTAPDETIAAVTFPEGDKYLMYHHSGTATNDIAAAFPDSQLSADLTLSDAEFIFTAGSSTDAFKIQSASTKKYLANTNGDSSFYTDASAEMSVTKNTVAQESRFSISRTDNTRPLFFYPSATNINTSGSVPDGSDENLLLLEKQDSVSEEDLLPGYQKADAIVSGKSYLISYPYENGKLLLLYPGGSNFFDRTKLVTYSSDEAAVDLVITGIGEGYTKAVIDGASYDIHVTEDHPDPDPGCSHAQTVLKNAKTADCENDGYTGDKICADCNAIIEKGSVISGGHDWDEGKITVEVTKTTDGIKELSCRRDPAHKKTEIIYASAYAPLADLYEEVSAITSENLGMYETAEAEALTAAYESAKQIVETKNASRSEMYHVKEALAQAKENLKPKTSAALRAELETAVAKAAPDSASQGNIPTDIWTEFKTAYDNAVKPIPDNITAEEEKAAYVWNLIKNLNAAQAKLDAAKEELARQNAKSSLLKAVTDAKAIYEKDKALYTPDSWKTFETAYIAAKNISEDADLNTIHLLLKNLTDAQKKLTKAQTQKENLTPVYDNVMYQVLNESKKTASVVKCDNPNAAKIKIRDSVIINGRSYKTVQINDKAFYGCSLKQVTIGKNITSIGKQCFSGCKKLNKIILKGTALKKIKSGAFKKTSAKMTVKVPKKFNARQRSALLKKLKKAGISKKAKIK